MTAATEADELPINQAAALANRSEQTLRVWLKTGRVTGRKVLGRVFVDRASLERATAGEPIEAQAQAGGEATPDE